MAGTPYLAPRKSAPVNKSITSRQAWSCISTAPPPKVSELTPKAFCTRMSSRPKRDIASDTIPSAVSSFDTSPVMCAAEPPASVMHLTFANVSSASVSVIST